MFCQCDDKSERSGATLGFLPRSSTHGIDAHKFHGSFRSCFFYLHSLFHMLTSKNCLLKNLPYRISCVILWFLRFKANQLIWDFQLVCGLSHHLHITGLFLHCKRLFYADHKNSAIDFSMMIHCKVLLTMFVSAGRITSAGKNQLIQYPELTYLITIASQQDWKIHLHWVNHV